MTLPINLVFIRKFFARAFNNGEAVDGTLLSGLDAQIADVVEQGNQNKARLEAISTSAGSLKYALVSRDTFTATAGQTSFVVTSYDTSASFALAYTDSAAGGNQSLIPPANVALTDATHVTLPAQTLGAKVTIAIFSAGNGTSQLASTSAGQGASLIGIADAGGYTAEVNLEGATQEIYSWLTGSVGKAYLETLLVMSSYLLKAGGTMTGAIAMGANKITGLAAGTAASNDAARMADITSTALQSTLGPYLTATYLPLSGGTLSGALVMGANKITTLADGTAAKDAVNLSQLQNLTATWVTSGTLDAARLPTLVGATGSVAGTKGAVPQPGAGDQDKILYGDATWRTPTAPIGSGYIVLQDQKSTGTVGMTLVSLAWTTRDLTTEVVDTGNHCSLPGGNQFALLAGTYRLSARAQHYKANRNKLRLYNVTDAAVTAYGESNYNVAADSGGNAHLFTRFTITSTKTFRIDHYVNNGVASGGGVETSDGSTETYMTIEIVRE